MQTAANLLIQRNELLEKVRSLLSDRPLFLPLGHSMNKSQLPPGTPIVRRFWREGKAYWISGYEVFDPTFPHSIKGGYTGIEPRRSPRASQCLVIGAGQIGRPIIEDLSNIQRPRSGLRTHTFEQVYGSFKIQSERVLEGFSFDEVDDLFIGKSE